MEIFLCDSYKDTMLDQLIDYHTLFMTIISLVGFRYIFRREDTVFMLKSSNL
uniref:Uncharacterized protein n=1 Tax=viral metagenome TaxID=1070528 RepID=A0A6C0F699_9ZZZZ